MHARRNLFRAHNYPIEAGFNIGSSVWLRYGNFALEKSKAREVSFMQARRFSGRSLALIAASIVVCGLIFAGCDDERVTTWRDPSVPILKHATWAWRPMPVAPPAAAQAGPGGDNRPVTSRDVMVPRNNPVVHEPDPEQEAVRQRVRTAIEQQLAQKGFTQASDPATADFLVDYHVAVRGHNVEVVRGYSGYPGLVCGPFGCWNSWGWGPPEIHYEDVHFREGMFVFDFVKRDSGVRAFRAVGQEPAHKNSFTQSDINESIHRLLKGLKGH